MSQSDESQMMTSHQGRTSESHKQIAQTNRTKQDDVTPKNGNNGATQVLMECLRLVNLTEICPSRRVGHFKAPC